MSKSRPPHCKCSALPSELQAHIKNWREGRESNPLKRDPQSRAAPFGFNPHVLLPELEPVEVLETPNQRFTKPPLCRLSYTGPHSSANGKSPVAIGVGVQVPAPLIHFQTHRSQNESAGVNVRRQRPAQQRHSCLFGRSVRLAMVVPAATCHKILPGILSALRSGNNMVER